MSKTEKLTQLYKKASVLDENLPAQLMDKLSIYGQILELLGGFHAQSVEAWGLAEAARRETIASAQAYGAELEGAKGTTAKDREAIAEVVAAEARRNEAKAEAESIRWKNAMMAVSEQIQIMKKRYEHLCNVAKGGI